MKKVLIIAGLLFGMNSIAQDYYHGAGAGFNMAQYKLAYTVPGVIDLESNDWAALPFIYYKATLGFEINRSTTFAASAYPGAGAFISTGDAGGNNYVGFQLPIMGELYFGDMEDANFNIGVGWAFNSILTEYGGGPVMGPQLALGGHFLFRDNMIGVRAYFVPGLNKSKDLPENATIATDAKRLFGMSFHYMFGQ